MSKRQGATRRTSHRASRRRSRKPQRSSFVRNPFLARTDPELLKQVSGVFVVDKPVGPTSHDVVQIIRRGTGIRRAGHTGTLDPRASGVLVVLLGPAVRLSEWLSASDKRYMATLRLGVETDTYDAEGQVVAERPCPDLTEEEIQAALQPFIGEIEQVPPPFSAIRVRGKRAYQLAREGKPVELKPRKVHIYDLHLLEWVPPELVLDIHASAGTYIRSLAHDLGKRLGCGAHLTALRRTQSGPFTLRDAVPLRRLQEAFATGEWHKYLIPAADALPNWPLLELPADLVDKVRHGHAVPSPQAFDPDQLIRVVTEQGDLLAIMQYDPETGLLRPRKVLMAA